MEPEERAKILLVVGGVKVPWEEGGANVEVNDSSKYGERNMNF